MILTMAFLKILMLTRSKVKRRNNDKVYLDCLSIVSLYVNGQFFVTHPVTHKNRRVTHPLT